MKRIIRMGIRRRGDEIEEHHAHERGYLRRIPSKDAALRSSFLMVLA